MTKKFWEKAGIRALRTVAQTLSANLLVGVVITPAMIKSASFETLYVVIAWLATGLLAGVASILTSLATGLPEVDV